MDPLVSDPGSSSSSDTESLVQKKELERPFRKTPLPRSPQPDLPPPPSPQRLSSGSPERQKELPQNPHSGRNDRELNEQLSDPVLSSSGSPPGEGVPPIPLSSPTETQSSPPLTAVSHQVKVADKITIRFQPIGGAPSILPKVFKISSLLTVAVLHLFLAKRLRPRPPTEQRLFLYLHNSFAPNPNDRLGNLYAMFKVGEELVVSYCLNVAFG